MNPALQQYILQSAMNQRQGQGYQPSPMMNGNGMASGMPMPAQQSGPGGSAPVPGYNPMPMQAPRSESPLGSAAMQVSQPDDDQNSPITRGAMSGLDASRKSYMMTEDQRRRAQGEAIMAFFTNMANSKNPTALGSFNESFGPALQQYNSAEKNAMGLNKEAIDDIFRHEKEDRLERLMTLKAENAGVIKPGTELSFRKDYFNGVKGYNDAYNAAVQKWVSNLDPSQRNPATIKYIQQQVKQQLKPYEDNIKRLKQAANHYGIQLDEEDMGGSLDMGYPNMEEDTGAYEQPSINSSIAADGTDMSVMSPDEIRAEIARKKAAGEP